MILIWRSTSGRGRWTSFKLYSSDRHRAGRLPVWRSWPKSA